MQTTINSFTQTLKKLAKTPTIKNLKKRIKNEELTTQLTQDILENCFNIINHNYKLLKWDVENDEIIGSEGAIGDWDCVLKHRRGSFKSFVVIGFEEAISQLVDIDDIDTTSTEWEDLHVVLCEYTQKSPNILNQLYDLEVEILVKFTPEEE